MTISTQGYNFVKVAIADALTSNQKVEIGSKDDFARLLDFAISGGVMQVMATVDSFPMFGTGLCNPYHGMSGFELGFITAASTNVPRVMVVQVTLENEKCYCKIVTET